MFLWPLCVTVLFWTVTPGWSQDPVLTPATLSDTTGNSADSSSAITWVPLTTGNAYQAGSPAKTNSRLAPYHSLMSGFVTAVFSGGIPTDALEKVLNNELGEITSKPGDYIPYFLGYLLCITAGVLFLFIFPIVTCCVCCCRCCCNNCGGDNHQRKEDAVNTTRKIALSIGLGCCLVMVASSSMCLFDDAVAFTTTLDQVSDEAQKNMDDIKTFLNNTKEQATQIASTDFDFFKAVIFRDLDNVDYLVGLPVKQDVETQTGIRSILTRATALGNAIPTIDGLFDDIEAADTGLNTEITNLDTALTAFRTTLAAHITTCSSNVPDCSGAPSYTSATSLLDPTNFNSLAVVASRTALSAAGQTDVSSSIANAGQQLDDIPSKVKTDSQTTVDNNDEKQTARNGLKTTINDLSDNIDPMMTEITDLNDKVNGNSPTFDLNGRVDSIESLVNQTKSFEDFRWYATFGIVGINGFIILVASLGVGCGWCFTCNIRQRPHRRATEAHCAGLCLTVSAIFMFVLAELFMLLVLPLFLIGSPIERMMCQPFKNLDELDELIQVYSDKEVGAGMYYLGDMLYGNGTVALTLATILRNCENNAGSYSTFKLDTQFNISGLLDYSGTLNVQTEIDSITVDLSTQVIYNSDLQSMMANLATALNLQPAYYPELNNDITAMDLTTLADHLEAFALTLGTADQANIQASATELRGIVSNEYADATGHKTALVTALSALAVYETETTAVDTGMQATQTYIQSSVGTVVRTLLNTFATRAIGSVDSYKAFALDAVENHLGPCQPVWNVFNTFLVYTLCYNVLDVFNCVWFSLGWCLFFFLPAIVFAFQLAKYFKRMERESTAPPNTSSNKVHPEKGPPPQVHDMPMKMSYKSKAAPANKVSPINDW